MINFKKRFVVTDNEIFIINDGKFCKMNYKQTLKNLGMEIAKYPNEMFCSNFLGSDYMRLSYYIKARYESVSQDDVTEAEEVLEDLKNGKKIIWGAFL